MRDAGSLRWAYRAYSLLVFLPLLAAATVVGGAGAVLGSWVSHRAGSRAGVAWARLLAHLIPMPVRVEGREHVDPGRSYVIVANHRSQTDILVLYGWLGLDFRWVMKTELRRVPVLGYACERIGHVYVDRGNSEAAQRSLEEAKRRIRGGTSILFFPEGTRSRTGELLPFKKGAFHLALELGLPVLPVAIRGTRRILPAGSLDLRPGRASLRFRPPIDPLGFGGNVEALAEAARRAVAEGLGEEAGPAGTRGAEEGERG